MEKSKKIPSSETIEVIRFKGGESDCIYHKGVWYLTQQTKECCEKCSGVIRDENSFGTDYGCLREDCPNCHTKVDCILDENGCALVCYNVQDHNHAKKEECKNCSSVKRAVTPGGQCTDCGKVLIERTPELPKEKCDMCETVDELAPSGSYCANHNYPPQDTQSERFDKEKGHWVVDTQLDWEETLAMKVTDIIFNREAGWSKKLEEEIRQAKNILLSEQRKEGELERIIMVNKNFSDISQPLLIKIKELKSKLENCRQSFKEDLLGKMPKEKGKNRYDDELWASHYYGYDECLEEVKEIIEKL